LTSGVLHDVLTFFPGSMRVLHFIPLRIKFGWRGD
jgi:hypothetical protein